MTIAPDLDLGALPDIARDRSPAGRARLFGFLTNLLIARWDRLAPGERTQLAELIAVLWARGTLVDQHRLMTHFSGSAEVPSALQALIAQPVAAEKAAIEVPTQIASTTPPAAGLAPEARPKKALRITVTQHPIVIRRKNAPPPPAVTVAPVLTDTATEERPGEGPASAEAAGRENSTAVKPTEAEDRDELPSVDLAIPSIDDAPERNGAGPRSPTADSSGEKLPRADIPGHDALLASTLLRAAPGHMPAPSVSDNIVPALTGPRDNPHRLTPELLGDMLASGDQARFEVMLASLAGIRAPLLRRMLRDSGDEAFAILVRSIGMDEASFAAQWQVWQQGQAELGRNQVPADRSRRKRISAFFAALTEHQIGRLVQRWRGSDGRVFAVSTTSS
ncbi:MAG TPA: DUF2336 domain-containing protein [Terriglobales bacterium]|nr:DUF2336 domain-containing protein [Terriglobales bacterium]